MIAEIFIISAAACAFMDAIKQPLQNFLVALGVL